MFELSLTLALLCVPPLPSFVTAFLGSEYVFRIWQKAKCIRKSGNGRRVTCKSCVLLDTMQWWTNRGGGDEPTVCVCGGGGGGGGACKATLHADSVPTTTSTAPSTAKVGQLTASKKNTFEQNKTRHLARFVRPPALTVGVCLHYLLFSLQHSCI